MFKIFFKIQLLAVIVLVPLSLSNDAIGAPLLDKVVATVNEEIITWSELRNTIALDGKQFLDQYPEHERKAKIKELERPFLDNMIKVRLQIQQAAKYRLVVRDSDIDNAIEEIKKKFNLTDNALSKSLEAEGLTMNDYRDRMRDQILLQKVVNMAVRRNIAITDDEIREYFEKNKELYTEEEKVRIRQIFFAMPEDEPKKAETEKRAEDLIKRINAGEDFANLAMELSEGPNRESGGDLGYIERGAALKEIDEAATSLNAGEISKPFWSPAGLHIIKVVDRTGGADLEKVKDSIKEILGRETFKEKYEEWITELREKAHVEIKL